LCDVGISELVFLEKRDCAEKAMRRAAVQTVNMDHIFGADITSLDWRHCFD
jgi:hypothetical protein